MHSHLVPMKIKLIFLISIFSLAYTTGFSQTETSTKKNNLGFSTGYTIGALKNLALAPLAYYDYNGLNHQLRYRRSSEKGSLFEIQLDYINSELKSDLIPVLNITDYFKTAFNFSYLKQVYNNNTIAVQVGLQSQSNVSYFFKRELYDFQQKLGVAGRFTFKIDEKHWLSSKLTLPFVMWRTSTFGESFYSVGDYQGILWSTKYIYKLSNHFDVKASYNFNYDRLQVFNTYRELQHQINLGINFKF